MYVQEKELIQSCPETSKVRKQEICALERFVVVRVEGTAHVLLVFTKLKSHLLTHKSNARDVCFATMSVSVRLAKKVKIIFVQQKILWFHAQDFICISYRQQMLIFVVTFSCHEVPTD